MNKLCPEALPIAISTLAAAIYNQLSPEEVGLVAAFLVHLGESLGVISAAQNASSCTAADTEAVRVGEGL